MSPAPQILLHLLAPDWDERETGGNVYNRALWSGLLERGEGVSRGPIEELGTAPPVLLVDSLYLDRIPELRERFPESILLLLAHYLPSAVRLGRAPSRDELSGPEARAFDAIDGYLATSPTMASNLHTLVPVPFELVLPPGSSGARRQESTPPYPLEALLVANLVPGKGILELLVELASRTLPGDHYILRIVGDRAADPDYADKLRAASQNLGKRILFPGALPHEELLQRYADHHLLVSASHMESYGMALAEAGEAGIPRLALDRGHTRAHFPSEDSTGLAQSHRELAQLFLETVRRPGHLEELRRDQLLPRELQPSWKERAAQLWSAIYDRWGRQE